MLLFAVANTIFFVVFFVFFVLFLGDRGIGYEPGLSVHNRAGEAVHVRISGSVTGRVTGRVCPGFTVVINRNAVPLAPRPD